ncbi:MAG: hemolysin family protein [bacterium]|nr:hemolysin family protein [bacterium]
MDGSSHLFSDLLIVAGLVLATAFCVAAEYAFVSVRRTRIDQLSDEGNAAARRVKKALEEPTRFISSTQLGITLASLGLGAMGEQTLAHILEKAFHPLFALLPAAAERTITLVLSFGVISYVLMVLGELAPKTLGLHQAERVVLFCVYPIELFYQVFRPFIWFLNRSSAIFLGLFGLHVQKAVHLVHSEEELKMLVQASHEGGVLEADEQALLHKAFEFADKTVDEVMVPRLEIQCVPVSARLQEVLALAGACHHTRFPVYEGSVDQIVGVVHVKDLLGRLSEAETLEAREVMRPVLAVPENKSISDMLTEFRRRRTQVAIVIDEFGGTAGLVTMEDLMEQLVGEISDEFEVGASDVEPQADGSYLIDGRVNIDRLNERFALDLPDDEFNTIAGLVFGEIGHTPEVGDEIRVGKALFRVEATNGRRATRIRLLPAGDGASRSE